MTVQLERKNVANLAAVSLCLIAQVIVRALYDYEPREENKLDFNEGDHMVVINKS